MAVAVAVAAEGARAGCGNVGGAGGDGSFGVSRNHATNGTGRIVGIIVSVGSVDGEAIGSPGEDGGMAGLTVIALGKDAAARDEIWQGWKSFSCMDCNCFKASDKEHIMQIIIITTSY